jgi:hypothetical protein
MTLSGRDRGSTRGTHGILTAVDWCFGERRKLDSRRKKVGNEVGGLASSRLRWRLRDVSFIGRRRSDGCGARTEKDARRARHTLAETA